MKRNILLALGLAAATATTVALPVYAHGDGQRPGAMMGGQGGWSGQQGAMMGGAQAGGMAGLSGQKGAAMGGGMGGQAGGMGGMMQMMRMMGGQMGGGMGGQGAMMGALAEKFDTNGDGVVTADEARAGLKAQLEKYDADGNGTLSLDEFQKLYADLTRERMVDRFQALDNDGNGQVTEDEITAPAKRLEWMQKRHDALDAQRPAAKPGNDAPMDGSMMKNN